MFGKDMVGYAVEEIILPKFSGIISLKFDEPSDQA